MRYFHKVHEVNMTRGSRVYQPAHMTSETIRRISIKCIFGSPQYTSFENFKFSLYRSSMKKPELLTRYNDEAMVWKSENLRFDSR
jgi:hypothetical protein